MLFSQNSVRIDDPNFGTGRTVTNPRNNPKQLLLGETTNVLELVELGIPTDASDVIKVVELQSVITPDASTSDWYELRSLRKRCCIEYTLLMIHYVWVVKKWRIIRSSVDYYVTDSKSLLLKL